MMKITTNYQNIWNIKAYFGKLFSVKYIKYIKGYIIRKAILSAFNCFLFHESILHTSEVVELLVTAYIIHQQIFDRFLPPSAQIFNQI